MPSYNTVYATLKDLARHEAEVVKAHGKDPATAGDVCFDNLQHNLRQREARIGRETVVNMGVAGTYYEASNCDLEAFDLEDKRRRLQENRRKDLTVEMLQGFVDNHHRELVGKLQWLLSLVTHVPELEKFKKYVIMRYRTGAAIRPLPVEPTNIHPLAACSKNENVITELKDSCVDMMDQIGQTSDDHHERLLLFHGDGLSYNLLHVLKQYSQFQDTAFERFEIIEPVLAMWHTAWTDLSRIFETHWGDPIRNDPSTLAYHAGKIGRRTPSSLKKVDYNEGVELVYLDLDARMLDCWRYVTLIFTICLRYSHQYSHRLHFGFTDLYDGFKKLAADKNLPDIEDLEGISLKLYRVYSSPRAVVSAMCPANDQPKSKWELAVPLGTPWVPLLAQNSGEHPSLAPSSQLSGSKKRKHSANATAPPPPPLDSESVPSLAATSSAPKFTGDRVLAQSIAFMRDSLIAREFTYAMAEGDVGRMYEALKVSIDIQTYDPDY